MVGRRRWAIGVLAFGLLLVGCGERAHAAARAPGLEVAGSAAGEGEGVLAWTRPLVLGDSEAPHAVVAPDGDVLVAATYREPLDLGGGSLPFNHVSSAPHLLVARFSSEGTLRWAHGLTPEADTARAHVGGLTVDGEGNAWLGGVSAGFALGAVKIPPGAFLARLSPQGALERVRNFDGTGALTVNALAPDGTGGVVLVGDFQGQRDFGDGVRESPPGQRSAFAVSLDASGQTRWSRTWTAGGEGLVTARAVAVDVFGGVHVAGAYAGSVCFGGPALVTVRQRTPFVLKLSSDGEHAWSRDLRGTEGTANALAVGPDRVFVGGNFSGRFYFRGKPHTSNGYQGFVTVFDTHGKERWARSFAATATALATDDAGQLTLAGSHDGGLDLGGGGVPAGLYVARFHPEDGASLWVRSFTSPSPTLARTVAVDSSGHTVAAGALARSLPEGTPYPRPRDGFLLRLRP
ncbi:hypothetical protein MVI01_60970 [Myxococcus virescens]|uniref:Lipoprotein n=1 Tax=Myxococcus virescens TaxID=83456 RepID=A0A511HL61_9BACT|nr:hypothetical protein MVI01_60970 [Myxococcus virescens]SDD45167.1 hypothetical protein SAMN04488504_101934 [Myxococcus virescens]